VGDSYEQFSGSLSNIKSLHQLARKLSVVLGGDTEIVGCMPVQNAITKLELRVKLLGNPQNIARS